MAKRDYYETLGVPKNASDEDRNARLRALLDLMSGLDHIPDAAAPKSHAPWAYSVNRFIERHCRPTSQPPLPASLCSRSPGNPPVATVRRISRTQESR